jgi:rhodanese-related sulfurtransferase
MVDEIDARGLADLLRDDGSNILLLDVREDDERATAAIEPSVHIPMHELPQRLEEIPRDRRVVVYCHHGGRSSMVAGYLEARGLPHVTNLTGGIDAYAAEVDRSIPRY